MNSSSSSSSGSSNNAGPGGTSSLIAITSRANTAQIQGSKRGGNIGNGGPVQGKLPEVYKATKRGATNLTTVIGAGTTGASAVPMGETVDLIDLEEMEVCVGANNKVGLGPQFGSAKGGRVESVLPWPTLVGSGTRLAAAAVMGPVIRGAKILGVDVFRCKYPGKEHDGWKESWICMANRMLAEYGRDRQLKVELMS